MKKKLLLSLLILFSVLSYSQSFKQEVYKGRYLNLPYQVMKPSDASQSKKYPLVIFLHGAGQRGNNNVSQMDVGTKSFLEKFKGDYSAIVLVPQCPNGTFWSNSIKDKNGGFEIDKTFSEENPTLPMQSLMDLINEWVDSSGLVDRDRVYIGGLSMGGFGTFELLWRMPGKFAAAFPICGLSDIKNGKLDSYASHTPIWMFQGTYDNIVLVGDAQNTYTKLQQIDKSKVRYTEYPVGHDSWINAFNENALIPWLFGYKNVEFGYYNIRVSKGNWVLGKAKNGILTSDLTNADVEQNWLISKVDVKSGYDDLYLIQAGDVSNSYLTAKGNSVFLSPNSKNMSQYWKLLKLGDGTYHIISAVNGYSLEFSDKNFTLGNLNANNNNQRVRIVLSKLFLIGGATSARWDINIAQEMSADGDQLGVFTWNGFLWNDDFKFQSTKFSTWETTYNAISFSRQPVFNIEEKIVVHPQGQHDFKFKLNKAGFYRLKVNMLDRNIVLQESNPDSVYIVGAAIKGWNPNAIESMRLVENRSGLFEWDGFLDAGEFKFLLNRGYWNPSLNPKSTQYVLSGSSYPIQITNSVQQDFKFNITKSMYYSLVVDMNNMTMKISEKKTGIPLFLLGTAVPGVGFNNKKGIRLEQLSDSIYTWTGKLTAGHFKFIVKEGTWSSIVPSVKSNENIIVGYTHSISDNYQGDYRFVIDKTANYIITVNLASGTMVVKNKDEKSPLYLVGDAVPNVGWNCNIAYPMTFVSEGVYTCTKQMNEGHFKFITKKGTWNSIFPLIEAHDCIINGYEHGISNFASGDFHFIIPAKGEYKITVDLINKTLVLSPVSKQDTHSLYIVGDAVPNVGWNCWLAEGLSSVSDNEFLWVGYLNKGHFKFISKLGFWYSLVPTQGVHQEVVLDRYMPFTNNYIVDSHFITQKAGYYTVKINTKNKSLYVKESFSKLRNVNTDGSDFEIISLDKRIEVKNRNLAFIKKARLIDVNGRTVCSIQNIQSDFYLGNDVSIGIYIVEIITNKNIQTYKVMVK